ncbi:isoleucine--tRNA ligase [Treponema pallidum]|uniref:Isoleucine--tRNA ligase n=6 Tax=Treponema pallidum TaxID=160 RepID=SYI_TREPA|nr:isoleucine--tRNA ligase [Treponema pallidum]B2S348.1 RecName: Full=Isoleucine--tRNA ligase; AltName: Full=Isoleucyl-tRNA synthetase; Short=IleRS [Treponema pallidum subsp. pallidum SS14]O83466.1 RecName: Full=Isoleucine--tRNA ligase; AltName: Full=Isoleucyl-tRNA synthetase; Short=IleRS [Treponema pallidum subsp. pallidum str. Nichols]AAC65439.1 isoleucyl-tRNA synthetase (ileS) [Treponema pallidum subsp. pallidum str. Nichols]ACD70877.1 isoleucyl-tRNA synthetase [Treponema pallidum subsp. pal
MYTPVDPKVDFVAQERRILAFWRERRVFEQSVAQRAQGKSYVFFDGPPFATGLPHFGHFVPSTIKDIIPRYQTMRGAYVPRRFGWDCHGLPIEHLIEQELNLNSKSDVESYGVSAFNAACRSSVLRYVKEWQRTLTRLGRWVDFDNDYKTMDVCYMESVWWVVAQLWQRKLLYEGYKILPYCPRCATALSNHELNLGGYQDVSDPAITVRFECTSVVPGSPAAREFCAAASWGSASLPAHTCFLAWTTTPWTLPCNAALALGPQILYVLIEANDEHYILARSRLEFYYPDSSAYRVVWEKRGEHLAGIRYRPLFSYPVFGQGPDPSVQGDSEEGLFCTRVADFVSTEDGTGVVHVAPAFGEDDYEVFKDAGISIQCPLDAECRFTAEVADYQGLFVKAADKAIIARVQKQGALFRREQISHAYPHCWRCASPLIYRAVHSWFVAVEKIKDKMLAANASICWQPSHIRDGRFGKWLVCARDWAISRDRYWGNPLPIWRCVHCGATDCIGSRTQLYERSGMLLEDLHKHVVDMVTIPCACGSVMRRVPEVLDCWFESGAMPYAQQHYPFEHATDFERYFPAHFISEGLDQTRGWFYTLTILAVALFERPAFENCIVTGLVLASDGKKMSKALRNYADPNEVMDRYGADALRLFLVRSAVVRADDLKYSDEGVKDILKTVIIPLWNSYSFYVTYANIDGIDPPVCAKVDGMGQAVTRLATHLNNPLDRWILSLTEKLVQDIACALDAYDVSKVADPIVSYVDQLNNWYIRRSRRRFWKSINDEDKRCAYNTLYCVLKRCVLAIAPVVPFITESIWQNIRAADDVQSVHLADYPVCTPMVRDDALEFKMETVQRVVSMARAIRAQCNLKVRQPLKAMQVITRNPMERSALLEMEEDVLDELNVKELVFHEKEDEIVEYRAKANFRVLGKELGSKTKRAALSIERLSSAEIQEILEGTTLYLDVDGDRLELTEEKILVQRIERESLKAINEGTLTVALDTTLTEDLLLEGAIRDLVRGVQNLRKERGFSLVDRICLRVFSSDQDIVCARKAYDLHRSYIVGETLAAHVQWARVRDGASAVYVKSDAVLWEVSIDKA